MGKYLLEKTLILLNIIQDFNIVYDNICYRLVKQGSSLEYDA